MQLKEEALFTLKFDGKPVINQLGELEQRLNDVKEAQKTVEKGTKEWAENKAEIKALELSIKQVREEMGTTGMTVQQLKGYYKQLAVEIDKLTPGTEAYIKKAAEMQEVNTALANHRQTIRGVNEEVEKQPSLWERAKSTAAGYLAAFGATELLERAFSFVQDGIKKALALSDMMAGVAKATGQSAEEVQQLSQELDKIDTRSSKESLMDIAQIGGQLGVANTELLGFVKSVDMANVALGDEFSGGAEEVSSKLGGLQKLFKETKDLQAGEAISKIGSAINELGAAGSATGPVVAEFTARIGQLGDLAPQISQTLGLGAAFQELGMTAEISASGLTNILQTASVDTATFAQQIGVSDAQMKNFIRNDPNEFLMRLAESFKGVPIDVVNTRLVELGIKSMEANKVMSLLKDQTDMVRQKQELASKAMAEGTSLQKEFNTVNSNAAAEYEKSQKAIALIATEVGQGLLPAITTGTRGVIAFVNIIRAVPEFVSENRTSFAALGVAVLAFNGHLILATAASIAHAAAEKARLIWTNSATTAQVALSAAMTANPIGVIVAAIALFVAGLVAIYNNSETVRGVINGLWEGIKVGVGIAGDITSAIVGFIKSGLEPMRPALELAGHLASSLWDLFKEGVGFVVSIHQAILSFVTGGLGQIGTALTPVRTALSSFWSLIDTGITKIKDIGSTIASFLHLDTLVTKTKQAASQIGDAFNKGYGEKLAEGRPKQLADHDQHLSNKKTLETKAAGEMVNIVTASDQKALDKKAAQSEKHRATEAKKEADHAKKVNDEAIKATNEGLKKIEDMRIASIKDDLQREIATIRQKRDAQAEAMMASKASSQVKAVFEKALNDQMIRDIEKAEAAHLKKKEKEDGETAKRILDLKIKLSGDENADKLQKLQDVAVAQRAQVEKDIKLDTDKAKMLKQINDNLIKDKERVEEEYRRKNAQQTQALLDAQFAATMADAQNRLSLAGSNASAIFNAKKAMLDAEYNHNKQKLINEAAEEKARNNESIQDADRRAAANKAIDDRLKAQLTASDIKYETDKTQLHQEKTEARRQKVAEYYDAVMSFMEGDFKSFGTFLLNKITAKKKNLTEQQQAEVDMIDEVGQYTVMAVQALQKLSQMKLDKELANIKKEKDTQLASWKDKYDKGLITKDEYEKKVDEINKEADQKTKVAQLEAFKRQQKIDIAMAVINGAQAALKSLAMLGWPLGLIAVAGAVATTAVQIAMIKKQQPPSLAKGGQIRNAGVPNGPRHGASYGDSGLSITRRDTGEEVAEMEGGEPIMVLSRNTYSNNRGVVDRLLHSSLHRNGAPIMLNGGMFGSDGGTYGDSLRKGGVRMFSDGGWMDVINNNDAGSSGGGGDGGESSGGVSSETSTDLQGQIDQSQKTQDDIAANTLATVDTLKLMMTSLADIQQQVKADSGTNQTMLMGLRSELVNGLMQQTTDFALQHLATRESIHQDLLALQSTMKFELPNLSQDLTQEFTFLRQALSFGLLSLRTGINTDVLSLKETTKMGLTDLQKILHDDLTKLITTSKTSLTDLGLNVHTDLDSLKLAQAFQGMALRTQTHKDFTDLIDALKAAMDELQTKTHQDLSSLSASTKTELQSVQAILNGSRQEQGYQSGLLSRIASKDLSVSVQTFVNVFNQIDVVVDRSNLK
ncbi:phage tail tape measure protein [Spirosoma sp.]|uniref:phage tail tape measure protein n=1 Tax=Spirosoma sp. TaxID=1899569 RepID=UPI002629FD75|nr:phage tail tape measure protein [Spirosoma sp.]MCX6216415.1 phage tail tape measure protein [Spirosoma sp.]